MEPCTFPDAEAPFDELVAAHGAGLGIDTVCSTTRWTVPVASAFAAAAVPRIHRSDNGMVALLEHVNPNGPVLTAFDCVWGFSVPFVGPDPEALVAEFWRDVLPRVGAYALSVSGVPPDGALYDVLIAREPVGHSTPAERCVADLTDGFEAWFGRRSSRFRRSLRSAVNRGADAGVEVEVTRPAAGAEAVAAIERVLAVEKRSWKTEAGSGLIGTDLGFFTRSMSHRFARTGDLRITFARLDGRDIGYVIGGIVGRRYRGFQHSFDDDYGDLSIGKLLQHHTIADLAAEGVEAYDMGMHMPYKESYTDRIEVTQNLIFAPRR